MILTRYVPLLLIFACAQAGPGEPPVDAERLGNAVGDLQLAESVLGESPILIRDSMRNVYYEGVLNEHGMTRAEFDSLMWIIRQEPAWIDTVYTRAGERLSRRQAGGGTVSSPAQ